MMSNSALFLSYSFTFLSPSLSVSFSSGHYTSAVEHSCVHSLYSYTRTGSHPQPLLFQLSASMPGRDRGHLFRTQLCDHGPDHTMSGCVFAHSLSELTCPDERRVLYPEVWERGLVHRWYGQAINSRMTSLLQRCYATGAVTENRPLWAVGLYLLEKRAECTAGLGYPWDFGLRGDLAMLRSIRGTNTLPFPFYDNLWQRLEARRQLMLRFEVGPSPLAYVIPEPELRLLPIDPGPPQTLSGSIHPASRASRAMHSSATAGSSGDAPRTRRRSRSIRTRGAQSHRGVPRRVRDRSIRHNSPAGPIRAHRRAGSMSSSEYSASPIRRTPRPVLDRDI